MRLTGKLSNHEEIATETIQNEIQRENRPGGWERGRDGGEREYENRTPESCKTTSRALISM